MKYHLRKVFKNLFCFPDTGWDEKDMLHFVKNKQKVAHFDKIIILEKTPAYANLIEREFVKVIYNEKPMWALFRCPCGCNTVISLSLQNVHKPHWKVTKNKSGQPTLFPSVWQKTGCCSHFCIYDGRIYWA